MASAHQSPLPLNLDNDLDLDLAIDTGITTIRPDHETAITMPHQPTTIPSPYPPFPQRTTHSSSPARPQPTYKPTPTDAQTYEDIKLNTPLLNGEDPEKGGSRYQHGTGRLRRACGTSGRVLAGLVALGAFGVLIWWIARTVWRDGEGAE